MKKKPNVKKMHNYYIKEIVFISILFYIPKMLNSSLPSTISILKIPIEIFWNLDVYIVITKFLLTSIFVIVAVNILANDDIKINSKILVSKRKQSFFYLFFGYFIFLYFLISILVQKSIDIQTLKGKDMIVIA